MAKRTTIFAPGEHYHVFNRGVNKQQIFFDKYDYARFLFYVLHYQSPRVIYNTSNYVKSFVKEGVFGLGEEIIQEIVDQRYVRLVSFTLMPNHFHLTLEEVEEDGVSTYMRRSLDGFSRYSHIRHKSSGHIFQGPFQAVRVMGNVQLLHLSSYIHKNPKELRGWNNKYEQYPWSSCTDYLGTNRWNSGLLSPEVITEQFESPEDYKEFIRTSTAKEVPSEVLIDYKE